MLCTCSTTIAPVKSDRAKFRYYVDPFNPVKQILRCIYARNENHILQGWDRIWQPFGVMQRGVYLQTSNLLDLRILGAQQLGGIYESVGITRWHPSSFLSWFFSADYKIVPFQLSSHNSAIPKLQSPIDTGFQLSISMKSTSLVVKQLSCTGRLAKDRRCSRARRLG